MTSKTNRPQWGERTLAIHAGEGIDPVTRASSPNLVMSSTFAPSEMAGFSARNRSGYEGYVYARLSNPTVKQLEEKLAALEAGEMALCFGSGMAAAHALLAGRLSEGDHLVISDTNYVGVAELVRDTLPRFGIAVSPVDTSDLDQVAAAIKPNTKMVWLETPANPIMRLTDIAAVAGLAHTAGVRDVVVDSTFASPIATRPLSLGADFVMHSLTKYIGGHGDALGGAVIGRREELEALNLEATVHYGGVLSPFNAWLILRGAATLPLRMKAHEETALEGRALAGGAPAHQAGALPRPSIPPAARACPPADEEFFRHDDLRGGRRPGAGGAHDRDAGGGALCRLARPSPLAGLLDPHRRPDEIHLPPRPARRKGATGNSPATASSASRSASRTPPTSSPISNGCCEQQPPPILVYSAVRRIDVGGLERRIGYS